MPRHTQEHKQFYKAKIRSLISIDHGISRRELQERMDKDGLHLDLAYIGKLYDEIMVERTKRMDRRLLNNALSSFEDTMTEVVRLAWEIANTPYISAQARVMALREIREAHNDVFQKLFDAGVFEKKLGTIDMTIRNAPLSEERKKSIRDVFELLNFTLTVDSAPFSPILATQNGQVGPQFGPQIPATSSTQFARGDVEAAVCQFNQPCPCSWLLTCFVRVSSSHVYSKHLICNTTASKRPADTEHSNRLQQRFSKFPRFTAHCSESISYVRVRCPIFVQRASIWVRLCNYCATRSSTIYHPTFAHHEP